MPKYYWWTFRFFRHHGYIAGRLCVVSCGVKLGPITLAMYHWSDGRWRYSFCALNEERFVFPSLSV